ncbi:MAG: 3-deoxy-7-phosphoheptulonate synthase [Rhodothermales bacterium]|jgi:3-deoxy-7-phosphoheptulonate synthase
MIIVLKPNTNVEQIDDTEARVQALGYEPRVIRGVERTIIAAVGDEISHESLQRLGRLAWVESVTPIQKRYKLASREFHPTDSVVEVAGCKAGGGNLMTIAGPCSVESREQLRAATKAIVATGVRLIRGGAYKPRTSPYDFQGMGEAGLELLAEIKEEFGVGIVTEIVGVTQVEQVAAVADILQVGARNCQNYHLLEAIAGCGRAVLLKRGMATSVTEWISAAEYLMVNGCERVILCERGIRTFETSTRNTLDLNSVAVAKRETHLPVMVDPSHAAGKIDFVLPLAKAGIAVGADGLIVEVHPNPPEACSDAAQQIRAADFATFMAALEPYFAIRAQEHARG